MKYLKVSELAQISQLGASDEVSPPKAPKGGARYGLMSFINLLYLKFNDCALTALYREYGITREYNGSYTNT